MLRIRNQKNNFYKFLILSLLCLSIAVSSINNDKMNLLNGISISFNLGFFRTTVVYLFLILFIFLASLFLLNKKLINKNSITTLLILYLIYQLLSLIISIVYGQKITAWILTNVFYPVFALIFMKKNWDTNINIGYLLNKIKLFIYLAILIGTVALIARRSCQFLDLLCISLLFLSYELLQGKNIKAILLIIGLALVSGFNLTWLFSFLFIVLTASVYYLRHLSFRRLIFISITIILALCLIGFYGFLTHTNLAPKLPAKERFAKIQLFQATGRTALWQKYLYRYEGGPFELLFGHGSGFKYTVFYEGEVHILGHLHNIFFDEFYKRGLIGLLLLLSIIVVSLKRRALNYLRLFFVALLIYGQSELITAYGISGIFFWMTIGMLNNIPKNTAVHYINNNNH